MMALTEPGTQTLLLPDSRGGAGATQTHNAAPQASFPSATWTGEPDALLDRTIGVLGGSTVFDLGPGTYTVEIYVNAALAASGTFVVS